MAPKRAPQRATAAKGGDWGVVGKGPYMGGCMGASSMGAGIKVVPTFSRATTTAPSRSTSGSRATAITRRSGASSAKTRATCSTAKRRAGDPDARAPVDAVLAGPHGACRGAAARAGWVWVVAVSSPHVQSHGKCVCMM